MLVEAQRLNDNGQHGEALKQAYQASEYVAVAYLAAVTGQSLLPNDAAYDLFADAIRDPSRHPALIQEIRETVGKVCALREAYEPALLNEITIKDAQQMIDHVDRLFGLVMECTQIS